MKNHYVYAHYTKKGKLFYIGKGINNRAKDFRRRNEYWNNTKNKHGIKVKYLIENLSNEEAIMLEIMAIDFFRPKCNFAKGGEGNTSGICHPNTKKAVKNMWKKMPKSIKSKEQRRRSKLRKTKKVKCSNGKVYKSCKHAAKDLKIKYNEHVTRVANGRRNSCYGYKFNYVT